MTRHAVQPLGVRDVCHVYLSAPRYWGLIPLLPRTKKPFEEDWPNNPVVDETGLDRFHADSNVGLVLGTVSGNAADSDLDSPEARALRDLLPASMCAIGRVGLGITHLFHTLAEDAPHFTEWVGYAYGTREKLIELRYRGRQTMLPGSIHPDGDRPFWASWPPPVPPVVTLAELESACRLVAAIAIIKRAWPANNSGRRDDFAVAVVGGLAFHNVPPEQVKLMVRRAAHLAGDEEWERRGDSAERAAKKVAAQENVRGFPWLEMEWDLPDWGKHLLDTLGVARRQVGSGTGDTPPKPGGEPGKQKPAPPARRVVLRPYVPFPTEYLPPGMREMVVAVSASSNADPGLIAPPALAVAASLIGTTHRITPNGAWFEDCCLWMAAVSDSGTRKTAAFDAATIWMQEEQERIGADYARRVREFEEEIAQWRSGDREDRGPRPERPCDPAILYVEDATIEGITRYLPDNIRGILSAVPELDTWFESLTRYNQRTTGYYLRMYNAGTLVVVRAARDRPPLIIPRALLSITGAVQPAILAKAMSNDNLFSGLFGRFLICLPPPMRNPFVRHPQIVTELEGWRTLCRSLRALNFADGEARRPTDITISPHALDLYVPWHEALDARLFDSAPGPLKTADSKLWGQVLRLALVHHLCSAIHQGSDTRAPVGVESMRSAIALGDWWSCEHARIYPYLLSEDVTAEHTLDDRILAYFAKRPGVRQATIKELRSALKDRSGTVTTASLTEAAQHLEATGRGTCTVSDTGGMTFSLPKDTPVQEED